jgi:hypothetical protein
MPRKDHHLAVSREGWAVAGAKLVPSKRSQVEAAFHGLEPVEL